MSESQILELEQHIADQKVSIERYKMAERLANNRDFKKLILDEFCVQECARYAQMSADPNLSAADRADCLAISQSAGHVRRWLQVIRQMGLNAENAVANAEQAIEEIRAEGGDD